MVVKFFGSLDGISPSSWFSLKSLYKIKHKSFCMYSSGNPSFNRLCTPRLISLYVLLCKMPLQNVGAKLLSHTHYKSTSIATYTSIHICIDIDHIHIQRYLYLYMHIGIHIQIHRYIYLYIQTSINMLFIGSLYRFLNLENR